MNRNEAIEGLIEYREFLSDGKDNLVIKEALEVAIADLNTLNDLEHMLISTALFNGTIKADFLINWLNNRHYKYFEVKE